MQQKKNQRPQLEGKAINKVIQQIVLFPDHLNKLYSNAVSFWSVFIIKKCFSNPYINNVYCFYNNIH